MIKIIIKIMIIIMIMIILIITIIIIMIMIIIIIMGMMSRPAHGAPAFTEHRHSKSPEFSPLINPYGYQILLVAFLVV